MSYDCIDGKEEAGEQLDAVDGPQLYCLFLWAAIFWTPPFPYYSSNKTNSNLTANLLFTFSFCRQIRFVFIERNRGKCGVLLSHPSLKHNTNSGPLTRKNADTKPRIWLCFNRRMRESTASERQINDHWFFSLFLIIDLSKLCWVSFWPILHRTESDHTCSFYITRRFRSVDWRSERKPPDDPFLSTHTICILFSWWVWVDKKRIIRMVCTWVPNKSQYKWGQ